MNCQRGGGGGGFEQKTPIWVNSKSQQRDFKY